MNILVLDNYDSFTFNIVHYIEDVTGKLPDIYRNDEIQLEEVKKYDVIILSPGPGIPDEAGVLKEVVREYSGKIPIFGICLGLQAIVEVFGGSIKNLNSVFHGVATLMKQVVPNVMIFKDIPTEFYAGRYHSWVASRVNFPEELEVTCEDEHGNIMAIRHKKYKIEAVQFHPESILTENGKQMLRNFINAVKK